MTARNRSSFLVGMIVTSGEQEEEYTGDSLIRAPTLDKLESCLDAVLFARMVPRDLYTIEQVLDCAEVLAGLTGRQIPFESRAAVIYEVLKDSSVVVDRRLLKKALRTLQRIHRSRSVEMLWPTSGMAQEWKHAVATLIALMRTH